MPEPTTKTWTWVSDVETMGVADGVEVAVMRGRMGCRDEKRRVERGVKAFWRVRWLVGSRVGAVKAVEGAILGLVLMMITMMDRGMDGMIRMWEINNISFETRSLIQ